MNSTWKGGDVKFKKKPGLLVGDGYIVRRFLFFPKRLPFREGLERQVYQTRWLEFADIERELFERPSGGRFWYEWWAHSEYKGDSA